MQETELPVWNHVLRLSSNSFLPQIKTSAGAWVYMVTEGFETIPNRSILPFPLLPFISAFSFSGHVTFSSTYTCLPHHFHSCLPVCCDWILESYFTHSWLELYPCHLPTSRHVHSFLSHSNRQGKRQVPGNAMATNWDVSLWLFGRSCSEPC